MDETYDVIVLGTGLKECILSGLLSVEGKRVLHLDRNTYYGGASASLQLKTLCELPLVSGTPITDFKDNNRYNVDIVPKFIMASGKLVQVLLHTDVVRYLEFKSIADTYVYRGGKIHHVPNTDSEAAKSPLMSMFEKLRCRKFFIFAESYDEAKPETHSGHDLHKMTMAELYKAYGLEPDTIDFIGHAMCMYRDDEYLTRPALEAVKRMQLYFDSLGRFGKSSFIYPLYGLGELPQAFARLSAIYGGTYILNTSIEEIVYDESGKVAGARISRPDDNGEHHLAKCSCIVADPSYAPDKVRKTGQVVRAICIMDHPVPGTNNSESAQIIIPQKQVGRKSDIYITVTSSANQVCPAGKYIAICAATVESHPEDPIKELDAAMKLIGPTQQVFLSVCDTCEPLEDGTKDKLFISKSYDATSHFETTVDDVLDMYRRITGKDIVLKPKEHKEDEM